MTVAGRVAAGISILLLIVAVRTVFVGYPSYTPLVFAQLYMGLFALAMMIPTLQRTGKSEAGDHAILVVVAACMGAVLFSMAAPRIGEPNYCGGEYLLSDVARVPSLYRCTAAPMSIAGWFAGWWLTIWMTEWWYDRTNAGSGGAAPAERSSLLSLVVGVTAVALLIVVVRMLFVGATSFKSLALAEIYLWLVTLFLTIGTLVRTEVRGEATDWYLLTMAAIFGAVIFWNLAPEVGEPNFCMPLPRSLAVLRDQANAISRQLGVEVIVAVRPTLFRCTALPFGIAGGFIGWWGAFWVKTRWTGSSITTN